MSWLIVIPFKGAPGAKSRLAAVYDDGQRSALARAFVADTVAAVRAVPAVAGVTVVSNEAGLDRLLGAAEGIAPASALAPVEVLPDPGDGLNGAVRHGIASFRGQEPTGHIAVLLGDLPGLAPEELARALELAQEHPLAYVADASGTGTTMITIAPDAAAEPMFGEGSAAAHAAAGFTRLEVPAEWGLRRDVDSPEDLAALPAPGRHTRLAMSAA
ncbi:2-phospho-L-lactate guanylyltransferase [Gryllotalpicola ginsengisoli]|uniref:2-phospho-L-lactate guanylyltransferase n=1 Tax=Gryllotalpicola ginsengisoli TaxID=444608 RepID=UPI0003B36AB2|nr:2-phospho-L-lactate guanylyltransferase [Gryllotalpicola ginsengisoli]